MYTGAEVEDDFPLQSLDSTSRVSETFVRLWGEEAVPFKLTLDMDFNSIKDTEAFKKDVQKDVATAAKIDIKHVRVIGLRAGRVVDMLIASEAGDAQAIVQDLEEQIKTPNSLLMQGTMTSKTKKDPYYCQTITYCTQYVCLLLSIPPLRTRARSLPFSPLLSLSSPRHSPLFPSRQSHSVFLSSLTIPNCLLLSSHLTYEFANHLLPGIISFSFLQVEYNHL